MKKIAIAICSSIIFLYSCGSSESHQSSKTEENIPVASITPNGDTVKIELNSNDQMKFDQTELHAKEGDVIVLTLTHTGKMPKAAMGHNFVLIDNRISLDDFGQKAAKAKAPQYSIPYQIIKHVIAQTEMIGGGESTSITFLSPAKGEYTYLCSFPGHYGMMKGKFIFE
jgi:azurin